jgi:integrase
MATQRGQSWQGTVYGKDLPAGRARRNFETRKEAEAWEHDSKARMMRNEPIDMGEGQQAGVARRAGQPYTLRELIEHVAHTRWRKTAAGIRQHRNAELIAGIIGPNKAIRAITKVDVDKARGQLLNEGNSPATVNRKVAALSTCLTEAIEAGLIEAKPKMAKYKESEHRIRRFTPEEERFALTYFERMSMPDLADYVVLSLDTGLRQGEVLNLRFQDCDADKLTVWGTGAKSGKTRSVPLTKRVKAVLERRRASEGVVGSTLVLAGWDRWKIDHQWTKLRETLHLTDDAQFVPHVMRHEFCSRLADKGLNAAVIQQLAGHSTLAVTQRYIHVKAEHLVRAIRELEAA